MRKSEWLEQYQEDIENYDMSILNYGDRIDSLSEYEFSIVHYDANDDYDIPCIANFSDY